MSPNSFDIPKDFFHVVSDALVHHMGYVMREGSPNPLDRYDEASRIHHADELNQAIIDAIGNKDLRLIRLILD